MCIAGNLGVIINVKKNNDKLHEYLFGEDQSRYIIEVNDNNIKEVYKILKNNSIYYDFIGKTQKSYLEVKNDLKISINELGKLNKFWFNDYFKEIT